MDDGGGGGGEEWSVVKVCLVWDGERQRRTSSSSIWPVDGDKSYGVDDDRNVLCIWCRSGEQEVGMVEEQEEEVVVSGEVMDEVGLVDG